MWLAPPLVRDIYKEKIGIGNKINHTTNVTHVSYNRHKTKIHLNSMLTAVMCIIKEMSC